jgi:hypothetical protein
MNGLATLPWLWTRTALSVPFYSVVFQLAKDERFGYAAVALDKDGKVTKAFRKAHRHI